MKATGIVRRIDDLGRVVIPREIRQTLKIREGDPIEIYIDKNGGIMLKKYSPVGEIGDFATEYADSLFEAVGHIVLITDRDSVVACAGCSKKAFLGKTIGSYVDKLLENRKTILAKGNEIVESFNFSLAVIAPVVVEGDIVGSVILCSREEVVVMGEMEKKLAETAAGFLAKQLV